MLIIADKRIPETALLKLSDFGKIIPFSTEGITYPSISCHPDIFMVQTENELIVAPNLTLEMKISLTENKISFEEGNLEVGSKYPQTAAYNAVKTEELFIHNLKFTDKYLLKKFSGLEKIHVKQAYTRCSLMYLGNRNFITSDSGIKKVLKRNKCDVLYVNPAEIILPGMKNGFFGGCCGIYGNTVYLIGNLDFFPEGREVKKLISTLGFNLVELYDGPLFDGGSLLFFD